jgi:hypothetical protein
MTLIVRERLSAVVRLLPGLEVALFTSFNFSSGFFEENVLPALFGCEPSSSRAAKDGAVNRQLQRVSVGVVCDPSQIHTSAKPCRYTVYPAFIPGRFFHPKNIILIGTDTNGERWLYIACLSANLSLSGWGSNCESFADTWAHARSEQPWRACRDFVDYLVHATRPPSGQHALARAAKLMEEMRDRSTLDSPEGKPSSKSLRVYFSPLHNSIQEFVTNHYGAISGLQAGSPYWGDVSAISKTLPAGAWLELVAARLPFDFRKTGLSAEAATGIDSKKLWVWSDDRSRFFHAKVLEIETRRGWVQGMGSCNFTRPGLEWANGNVESMMFDFGRVQWPETEALPDKLLPSESELESPDPFDFFVAVTYDWNVQKYEWHCDGAVPSGTQMVLSGLDGQVDLHAEQTGTRAAHMERPVFQLHWPTDNHRTSPVTEVNLQSSDLVYVQLLTALAILDSWALGAGSEPLPPDPDPENEDGIDHKKAKVRDERGPATRDFNYFEFYRTLAVIRRKLESISPANPEKFDLLVARTDSVCRLADSMMEQGPRNEPAYADTTRMVVHLECLALLGASDVVGLKPHKARLRGRIRDLRKAVTACITADLRRAGQNEARATELLEWYLKELRA